MISNDKLDKGWGNERNNTYMIDTENGIEMARLLDLDIITTENMGGLFPERDNLDDIFDVLDIACGPGGWVHEIAYNYPEMEVMGIDISHSMIEYARAHAKVRQLTNASFRVMDVRDRLDFPDYTFDLVNARFTAGFMSPESWPNFAQECRRITRPGGTIRFTEGEGYGVTNSSALERLNEATIGAMYRAEKTFTRHPRSIGVTPRLRDFLRQAGCQDIRYMAHAIDYSTGTRAHTATCRNYLLGLQLTKPFLLKYNTLTTEEFDDLFLQVELDMASNDFYALFYFITVWGENPG